jgi:hypothetical protein
MIIRIKIISNNDLIDSLLRKINKFLMFKDSQKLPKMRVIIKKRDLWQIIIEKILILDNQA